MQAGYILLSLLLLVVSVTAQDCGIIVPAAPLTAAGLATPYILTSINPASPCSVLNPGTSVFVEVTVIDPATGNLFVYHPLVADSAAQVAVPPVVPALPANAIVGIWFGANGMTVTLQNATNSNSLRSGNCVNGVPGSIFGQYAYCNAQNFFRLANQLIAAGVLVVPPIGTTNHGEPCPTTRSFGVVDQDQSDNVVSTYIVTSGLQVAQNTIANRGALAVMAIVGNGSDNRLLDVFIDPASFCKPFTAPDLIDPTVNKPSLALNELSAANAGLTNPALVPSGDPMVLVNNAFSLAKLNAYRIGVNQPTLTALDPNDNLNYCNNLAKEAGVFLATHYVEFMIAPAPDTTVGNNLLNFLANRFFMTWGNLDCAMLTLQNSPITVTLSSTGAANGSNILAAFGSQLTAPPAAGAAGANLQAGSTNLQSGSNAGSQSSVLGQQVNLSMALYVGVGVLLVAVVINVIVIRRTNRYSSKSTKIVKDGSSFKSRR